MAPNKKPASDAEFLKAAYDQLGDITLTYAVSVGFTVVPTIRRGVFLIRARAAKPVPNAGPILIATAEAEYPNSQNGSLSTCLWSVVNRLEREVGEKLGDAIDKA